VKKSIISIEDFKKYMSRVRCINLLHYKLIPLSKLREIGHVERLDLDAMEDFALLRNHKTVWYENDKHEQVSWDAHNAGNVSVEELVGSHANIPMKTEMTEAINELRGGLNRDIEIVSISDTIIGETVIVEGGRRAAALYYLYDHDQEALNKILNSSYKILNIVFLSPAASLLFPCDFVNICRDVKQSGT
jgi:hypothetical protein